MFLGTFSTSGPGRLVTVTGMMNSELFRNILETHLLPTPQSCFPDDDGIFQQDLATCHTSKKLQKIFEEAEINVLEWPGNFPDLNLIENLWTIVEGRLRRSDCSRIQKLVETVIQV